MKLSPQASPDLCTSLTVGLDIYVGVSSESGTSQQERKSYNYKMNIMQNLQSLSNLT